MIVFTFASPSELFCFYFDLAFTLMMSSLISKQVSSVTFFYETYVKINSASQDITSMSKHLICVPCLQEWLAYTGSKTLTVN